MQQIRKLGMLIKNLSANQLAYHFITKSNNLLYRDGIITDIIGFVEDHLPPCIQPDFSVINQTEAWGYDGVVVATTLNYAKQLIKSMNCRKKIFYVWDLEWLRGSGDYASLQSIYHNQELTLVARSESHADMIEKMWNTPVNYVVSDCDVEKLLQIGYYNEVV